MELSQDAVTIFSLVLNAILVGVVIVTYRQSIKQYETVNRPWLVFNDPRKTGFDNYFDLYLENIGNLPAEKISIITKPTFYYKKAEKNPSIEGEPIKIGIIMPKQKHHFTLNYFTVDDIIDCEEYSIDIFVTYNFGSNKKTSKFNLYANNLISHREVSCVEAD